MDGGAGGAEVMTRDGHAYSSKIVIGGADGAPSRVAASLGLINEGSAAAVMSIARGGRPTFPAYSTSPP